MIMRWLLLALALIFSSAYSQEYGNKSSSNNKQTPSAEKRGTDEHPFTVQILPSKDAERGAAEEKRHKDEKAEEDRKLTTATICLAVLTGILALFTGGLWWATYRLGKDAKATSDRQAVEMQKSLALARKEFISTHRPKIRVRNIVIRRPTPIHAAQPPLFAPGTLVSGQLYIANVGGTEAHITGIGCWVDVRKHISHEKRDALPMERPYEGENPNIPLTPRLMAGESTPLPFQSERPLEPDAANQLITGSGGIDGWWHLYVMGFIEYTDSMGTPCMGTSSMGTPRRTEFCREFDPIGQRFVKVDNEDYEHEA